MILASSDKNSGRSPKTQTLRISGRCVATLRSEYRNSRSPYLLWRKRYTMSSGGGSLTGKVPEVVFVLRRIPTVDIRFNVGLGCGEATCRLSVLGMNGNFEKFE